MNTLLRACYCLLLLFGSTAACSNRDNGMSDDRGRPQFFATAEEAARQGKADLVSLLRSSKDLNVGVDAATLEHSQPGKAVRRVDLDFEKLLTADAGSSLESLVKEETTTIVPLVVDNNVVTIIELSKGAEGWRTAGLAGKSIADDLSVLQRSLGATSTAEITLYEVPNLQAQVYGVRADGAELLYTNYGNRYSLGQGVATDVLILVLKADAIAFQAEYGRLLKEQQLVR